MADEVRRTRQFRKQSTLCSCPWLLYRREPLFASAFLFVLLLIAPACAQSCDDDSIDTVSSDGEIIKMFSGAVFRVAPSDQLDTALWLPAEDVLICNDNTEIINTDESGERASVSRSKDDVERRQSRNAMRPRP